MKHITVFEDYSEPEQRWKIFAGLNGGFGGAEFTRIFVGSKDQAENEAYRDAIESYESYEGMHGLRTIDDIMEEDEVDEFDAEQIYNDERESWLDYYVEPAKPGDTDESVHKEIYG